MVCLSQFSIYRNGQSLNGSHPQSQSAGIQYVRLDIRRGRAATAERKLRAGADAPISVIVPTKDIKPLARLVLNVQAGLDRTNAEILEVEQIGGLSGIVILQVGAVPFRSYVV